MKGLLDVKTVKTCDVMIHDVEDLCWHCEHSSLLVSSFFAGGNMTSVSWRVVVHWSLWQVHYVKDENGTAYVAKATCSTTLP